MVEESLNERRSKETSQVWTGLGNEVRQQAIHLLAQLAFNLVVSQSGRPPTREQDHASIRRIQS